jgi:hypothetical protein
VALENKVIESFAQSLISKNIHFWVCMISFGCSPIEKVKTPAEIVVESKNIQWPAAVKIWGPIRSGQKDRCFPAAADAYCIEGNSLVPLPGVTALVDTGSRNAMGDWIVGNRPLKFFSHDGGSHVCTKPPGDLESVWLGEDEVGLVIATVYGSNWISRDECKSWQRLPIDEPFVSIAATGGVLTAAAVDYSGMGAPRIFGFRHELVSGNSTQFPLEFPHARGTADEQGYVLAQSRIAADKDGFLGMGSGLTRFDRQGQIQGTTSFPDLEILAACRNGPVLATERGKPPNDWQCRLRAFGPDGKQWWRQESVMFCRPLEEVAACADQKRLFIEISDVLLEVTAEGLKPLTAPAVISHEMRAILDGDAVRLVLSNSVGETTVSEWTAEREWSWLGLGEYHARAELDSINVGPMKLNMRRSILDLPGCAKCSGHEIQDATDNDRPLTGIRGPNIDLGPPQILYFSQLNFPSPALLFRAFKQCVIVAPNAQNKASALPCDPIEQSTDVLVVADPLVNGRWILNYSSFNMMPRPESVLVEDYGQRVTKLGQNGTFVFDANGSPLRISENLANVYSIGSPTRLGYIIQEPPFKDTKFVPFVGEETIWKNATPLAVSPNQLLLQVQNGLLKVNVKHKMPQ